MDAWEAYVTPCEGVGVEMIAVCVNAAGVTVTPCEGVGVEISNCPYRRSIRLVTPCEGVGVEIKRKKPSQMSTTSRLARAWE